MKGEISNQESFFDQESEKDITIDKNNFFYHYVMEKLFMRMGIFKNGNVVLDYGCGIGTIIEIFNNYYPKNKIKFIGVDISKKCIQKAKQIHPQYKFYKIFSNNIPVVKKSSCDGAYIINVLHHSKNHNKIYHQINSKLTSGSRFVICDLSSNNPFVKLGRKLFRFLPNNMKRGFDDDLVIDGKIPEKYKVDIDREINLLKRNNFKIIKVEYWQLFLFLFGWVDKFIPFSKSTIGKKILEELQKIEEKLIKFEYFKKRCECFYIECEKK